MKALIIMSLGVLYAVRRKGHFPLKAIYIFSIGADKIGTKRKDKIQRNAQCFYLNRLVYVP